jgi:hypothetical protein
MRHGPRIPDAPEGRAKGEAQKIPLGLGPGKNAVLGGLHHEYRLKELAA